MRKLTTLVLSLAAATFLVSAARAEEKAEKKAAVEKKAAKENAAAEKTKKKPGQPKSEKGGNKAGAALFQLPGTITLSEDQKQKLEAIRTEFQPKLKEVQAKANVLTAEQKEAMKKASQDAKAAGKKGKDAQAAVEAALNLTDEQKKQRTESREQMRELQTAIRGKIRDILFEDQKKLFDESSGKKPKKAKANAL